MRAGGGKSKGASFERAICVALSLWVSKGKREDAFWRSAMSGGRATVRRKAGKQTKAHCGDISATAPEGHALVSVFSIECKNVASMDLEAAAIFGRGHLVKFWHQCSMDALAHDKHPLLIVKQNRWPIMVFLRHSSAANYFGAVSQIEKVRLFKMDGYRVSGYFLEDLLKMPYKENYFQ